MSMTFDDVESFPPTQVISLSAADIKDGVATIPLQFVKVSGGALPSLSRLGAREATLTVRVRARVRPPPPPVAQFQCVQSVAIFVADNLDGSDVTQLSRVHFFGMPIARTNVNDIKKQG
jgi:hypothetical protein